MSNTNEANYALPDGLDRRIVQQASVLGYIVIEFSRVELYVDGLIRDLLWVDHTSSRIVADLGGQLSNRIELAKRLIHANPMPSQDFTNKLVAMLDAVKSDLLPIRNRLIHDIWFESLDDKVQQVDRRTMLRRETAGAARRPADLSPVERKPKDLIDFYHKVQNTAFELGFEVSSYNQWRTEHSGERPDHSPFYVD